MRGIRILNNIPSTMEDAGIDGLVLYLEDEAKDSLIAQIGAIISLLTTETNPCSIIVVSSDSLRPTFMDTVKNFSINPNRFSFSSLMTPSIELADELFETFFSYGYQRRGQTQTVNISARTRDSRPRGVLLDLDWRTCLNVEKFPSIDEWRRCFVPALHIVRRTLLEKSERLRIQFDCHLPLPAAFALGYWFNIRVADVGVWSRRGDVSGLNRQFWFSKNKGADIQFDPERVRQSKQQGSIAVIELTTFVSIETAVASYLRPHSIEPSIHLRVPLQIAGETISHIDEALALAYASQIGQLMRRLTAQGITDTYLFARIPSALAVLIGQRLLACNRVHLHWYQNPEYRFALTLG